MAIERSLAAQAACLTLLLLGGCFSEPSPSGSEDADAQPFKGFLEPGGWTIFAPSPSPPSLYFANVSFSVSARASPVPYDSIGYDCQLTKSHGEFLENNTTFGVPDGEYVISAIGDVHASHRSLTTHTSMDFGLMIAVGPDESTDGAILLFHDIAGDETRSNVTFESKIDHRVVDSGPGACSRHFADFTGEFMQINPAAARATDVSWHFPYERGLYLMLRTSSASADIEVMVNDASMHRERSITDDWMFEFCTSEPGQVQVRVHDYESMDALQWELDIIALDIPEPHGACPEGE